MLAIVAACLTWEWPLADRIHNVRCPTLGRPHSGCRFATCDCIMLLCPSSPNTALSRKTNGRWMCAVQIPVSEGDADCGGIQSKA
ncbi:hypothetical protein H4582DRAFT_531576 [Lactarius indigo]|nr:hypothetical protein H4582DRAFT_531576 [Lactarius indigo]